MPSEPCDPSELSVEQVREWIGVCEDGIRRDRDVEFYKHELGKLIALCRAYLAAQDAEDERPSPDLPQAIKDELFKQACLCADTEADAQKQPCACRTAMLLEQIEQWGKSLAKPAARPQMSAGEFAGLVSREIGEREAFYLKYDDAFAKGVVTAMHHSRIKIDELCRQHNIEIVRPKE